MTGNPTARSVPTTPPGRVGPAEESGGRDVGAVEGPASAARLPPAGQVVILCPDAEVADLVAQGIAVDAERTGGAAEIAPVRLQGGHDELPFELPPRLLQRHAPAYELI